MSISAIIVAAGSGSRIGGELPKQYRPIAGKPVLFYTLQKFETSELIDDILLIVAQEWMTFVSREIVEFYGFEKVSKVIAGGDERQDSVYAGLQALAEDTKIVAIHDAVRPFVSVIKIEETIFACEKHCAAILAVPPRDTVKTASSGFVSKTPRRDSLFLVQTPQTFRYDIIFGAYQEAYKFGIYQTDDAALVERTGQRVKIVEGDPENIKITLPFDFRLAEMMLQEEAS